MNPVVQPAANPNGPVTATDFLTVSWLPPLTGGTPTRYEYRINGDPYVSADVTSATGLSPRNSFDPITLQVRAVGCSPEQKGLDAASPVYSLAPPVANFSSPTPATPNTPITFTDTSSPQATSWLWVFGDGTYATGQSATHTFTQAGQQNVWLVASNGSGSSLKIQPLTFAGAAAASSSSVVREFDASDPERRRLDKVVLRRTGNTWLHVLSEEKDELILFLRFLDPDGNLFAERRLSLEPEQDARFDIGAYGLKGTFSLELVSSRRFHAVLVESVKYRNDRRKDLDDP